jgi:hypothetical protein
VLFGFIEPPPCAKFSARLSGPARDVIGRTADVVAAITTGSGWAERPMLGVS